MSAPRAGPDPGSHEAAGPTSWGARAIRDACPLDDAAIAAVRDGFVRAARGRVRQPPVLSLDLPEVRGELDVKTAWVAGWDVFCVKLSSGFFANPDRGLPSASGLMVVLDAATGRPRAILADDGHLTELRTAAAGALAADALARKDAGDVAIVGAGAQARWQLRALAQVRTLRTVRLWARDPERARPVADAMTAELGVDVRAVSDLDDAVGASDLIVTTTPARTPLFRADAVAPGAHVTAVGSDGAGKRELPPALLRRATPLVVDDVAQSRALGELQGVPTSVEPESLGRILAGDVPGRRDGNAVTVCDLTGLGVQDSAIARHALGRLEGRASGS